MGAEALLLSFVNSVQTMYNNQVASNKNVTANLMLLKEIIKEGNKLGTVSKSLERVYGDLSTTSKILKNDSSRDLKDLANIHKAINNLSNNLKKD
jgi:hypothetical protein